MNNTTMTDKKNAPVKEMPPLFGKKYYQLMIIVAIVIIIGMFLMSGGKNEDPNKFDYILAYSTTRVTIATITIILGLVIEFFAILKKPSA
jgi:uncharacterized membrane protein YciS (DUF1049 family)